MNDNTPVIIGVGQYSERVGEPGYAEMSHMDLGGAALKAAFQRLESRPLPEHLKLVVDQLDDDGPLKPCPSPRPTPEP